MTRFTTSDPHNWNGRFLTPVEGCDCSRCEYLRAFEEGFAEDVQSDPLPNDFNRSKAA